MEVKSWDLRVAILIFLLPGFLVLTLYFVYPILHILILSFFKWDGIGEKVFVGLANYRFLFRDQVFYQTLANNFFWSCSGGLIHVPLAMLIGMLLRYKPTGWKILRTVYFIPNMISVVALGMMWMAIYNNSYGVINSLLEGINRPQWQLNWLGNTSTALSAIIFSWIFNIGYFMVILLASMKSIPDELYDSAKLDGATKFQLERYITFPMIKRIFMLCIILSMIGGLKHFEFVFIMTGGGPSHKTMLLTLYLYRELKNMRYGLANSAGVILMFVGILIMTVILYISREKGES